MKLNMLIGKRQIVLACLVVILGVAIYLNWEFTKSDKDLSLTGQLTSSGKNYGDAQLVDTTVSGVSTDYFAKARLDKQKTRDEAVDTVQTMLKNSKLTEKQKEQITKQAAEYTKKMESETKIEGLVKAKGFKDCVAYIDEDKASIVVKTNGLMTNEAAQIMDIVITQTDINAENVNIVEVK